jgi:hypothetical protein
MTTPPVVSVTDEMIAELEKKAQSKHRDGFRLVHNIECVEVIALTRELRRLRADVCAILAERAALKRDTERFEWWFKRTRDRTPDAVDVTLDQWRASLDAAMQP